MNIHFTFMHIAIKLSNLIVDSLIVIFIWSRNTELMLLLLLRTPNNQLLIITADEQLENDENGCLLRHGWS